MKTYKVTNIDTSDNHYLIRVFNYNMETLEIHCYSKKGLDKKVTELCNDKNVHDIAIYVKVDFDLEEEK